MTAPTLHYVHDPLCGWCYAAAPMVRAARDAGVPVVLHGGGLWEPATTLGQDRSRVIRQNDERIAALTGLPFGSAYMEGLLTDPATLLWSRPTISAVLAAGRLEAGADLAMLHAIQEAHYVAGRRVVETLVLTDLAGGIGLAGDAFLRLFNSDAADGHIERTRRWMGPLGLRGFPGFVLQRGAELVRLDHEPFYGRPEAFARTIVDPVAAAPKPEPWPGGRADHLRHPTPTIPPRGDIP